MLTEKNIDRVVFESADHKIVLNVNDDVFSPTGFAQNFARILDGKIPLNSRVCELGVGTGVLSVLAGFKGATVVGLDRNHSAIDLAPQNWRLNGLPDARMDFRWSDLFSGLQPNDMQSFDIIWSNPPVLPELANGEAPTIGKYRHEISGPLGRNVLDAMITGARRYLKAHGSIIVVATSLQGWRQTKVLLDQNWSKWSVIEEIELPLTDECGPAYVKWWRDEESRNDEIYIEQRGEELLHKLWFIQAWNS